MRRRPAHRGGEAAGERERGDRLAGGGAEDAAERRESRVIKRSRDGDTENEPGRKIGRRMRRDGQQRKPERAEQRSRGHHHMPAMPVDQAADRRCAEAGDQEREREAAHRERERETPFRRDQRHQQHRRIEQRPPRQNLRDAEDDDGAPGTENEIVEFGHCGRQHPSTPAAREKRECLTG
jgi:hypothetical protein